MATKAEMFRYLAERAALSESLRREAARESIVPVSLEQVQGGRQVGPVAVRKARPDTARAEPRPPRTSRKSHERQRPRPLG